MTVKEKSRDKREKETEREEGKPEDASGKCKGIRDKGEYLEENRRKDIKEENFKLRGI